MIPVLGFATLSKFDMAERLLRSIDYPVQHLVIVDNSGLQEWEPVKPALVEKMWVIRVPYGLGLVGAWNLVVKSTPYERYWVLVNDDAWFAPGSLETIAREVNTNALNFVDIIPAWSCVVFGEGMVEKVGLYDERFYPLYFDDNDLERRVDQEGIAKNHIQAKVFHENSSTLNSGYQAQNQKSYVANHTLYEIKGREDDFSQGEWSLKVRRANRWD